MRPLVWFLVAVLLVVVGAYVALSTSAVQHRLVERLRPRLEEYLGRQVRVGGISYELFPLTLELRDVELSGPQPGDPPVATVRRISVLADAGILRRRTLTLREIEAEGLEVYLHRYADGSDNFPRPERRPERRRRPFELDVEAVRIVDSVFWMEDEQVPLELEARGVSAALLGMGGVDLQGRVVVEEAWIQLPDARPYRAAVAAQVSLTREGLVVRSGRVASPEARLVVEGEVHWRQPRRVSLRVRGDAGSSLFRSLGYLEDQVEGEAAVDGAFTWAEGVWGWRGSVASERLRLLDWWLRGVAGTVAGDRNGVVFELLAGRYATGSVTGRVEVDRPAPGELDTAVELSLAGIDVETFLDDAGIPVEAIAGSLGGDLTYRFGGTDWRHGEGWGNFHVSARLAGGSGLLVSGAVPLTVDHGLVRSLAVRLEAPQQVVTADAIYDLGAEAGEIVFHLASGDLGPVGEVLGLEEEDGSPPLWLPRSGTGEIAGTLFLRPEGLRAVMDLDLSQAVAPGIAAERVVGLVEVTRDAVERLRLELSRGDQAALVTGRVPFDGEPLRLALDVAGWPLEDAAPWLPFDLPVAGPFTGSVSLRGEGDAVVGEVAGEVAPARLQGREAGRLRTRLAFDRERVTVSRLDLTTEAGELLAQGVFGIAEGELDFEVSGEDLDLGREPFASLVGGALSGRGRVAGHVGGTLERPSVELTATTAELAIRGRQVPGEPPLLHLVWSDGRLQVAGSLLGLVELEGGGTFDLQAADVAVGFSIPDLDRVGRFLGEGFPELSGSASGTLRLAGPLSPGEMPEVTAEIDRLAGEMAGYPLRNREPIRLVLRPEELAIESLYLGDPATDSEVFAAGTIGLAAPHELDLRLQASIENRWLEPFLPGDLQLSGASDLLATLGGDLDEPRLNGQAEVREAGLLLPDLSQSLEDLRAVLLFYPDALVIDSVTGEWGGGTVRASGRVDWPFGGEDLDARLQVAARRVTLRYPEGWQLRGDADLVWGLEEGGGQAVRGVVNLDRAYYLRDVEVGLLQLLQRFFRHTRQEVGATDEALAAVGLNVLVRAPGSLRIRNNLADLRGSAEITVRGTLERPVAFGQAEAEPGGTLVYNENEYRLERGTLTFANPYRIEPLLDLVATTEVADYDVTLSLFGNLERLNATFSSDPPLPDIEVLSLLLSGSPTRFDESIGADLGGEDASSSAAAEALLVGQAASLISRRVNALFGFDAFRIDPLATSGENISSARVTVGKRLSRDLYITYSYDPSSTAQQRLQVEWQVSDDLSVVLTQDDDSYTVDLLWEQRF